MTNYYSRERSEIQGLLPKKALRILDVGAGVGATLKWIKRFYPDAKTTGIELNPALKQHLQKNADVAIIGKIEECFSELERYDLILLLDVLEHLVDPESVLNRLSKLLGPGGQIIVSVPNVAHFSVSLPLLFKRQFTYTDAGILDRTHLKFFVEESAIKLLNNANFTVTKGMVNGLGGPKSRLLNRASFGLLLHYLARQYIMLAQPNNDDVATQKKLSWAIAD